MESPQIISRTLASRTPANAVKRRQFLFEQASEVAFRAVLAISQDNEQEARAAVDELRFLKMLIQRGEPLQAVAEDISTASPVELQLMRLAFDVIAEACVVIRDWIQHNQQDLVCSSAQTDPNAWQRIIDLVLPDAWSFDTDLFLIFGTPPAVLIDTLRARGQRRIVVLAEESEMVGVELGADFLVSNELASITHFVRSMRKPYPKLHAKIRMCDDVDEDAQNKETETKNALLEKEIQQTILLNWMDNNTERIFAQRWVEQGVANIPAIVQHKNLHALDGQFRDRPAILIAPGPSLDKNIGLLHQAKNRAVLIAPLQSLRVLYKAGIQPDFVTVIDATDLTVYPYDCFNDVPDEFLTTLVIGVNCHPNVIRRFKRVYFFSAGGGLDGWVQDIVPQPLLPMSSGTVAITGLLLAQHWGCNPITLVGQDLALAGNRRYAEESLLNILGVSSLMTLPGYYGETVQSPIEYFMFHDQFEKIAEAIALSSPETHLFNSTEGGAFIKGFVHEPLHAVLERYVAELPENPIVPAKTDDGLTQTRRNVAYKRLQTTQKVLLDLQQQVKHLMRLSQQSQPQAATLQKLSEKEQLLRKNLKKIHGFTSIYNDDMDQAVFSAAQATTLHENLVASQALYQVVADSCEFFHPLVEAALVALDKLEKTSSADVSDQKDGMLLL